MVFVWDEGKNRFEAATRVFEDPQAVSYVDQVVDAEERWHTVGLAGGVAVLVVVHLVGEDDGEETIRIISARKASPSERDLYYSA
jgi:uncharacterized protein